MKKYLALFLAALMLLSLAAGCALTGSDTPADPSPTPGTTGGDAADLDLEAVVAEVGDKVITLGQVKEMFDSYVNYFMSYGYDLSGDTETLNMLLDDVVNTLVETELIAVKAKQMGYDTMTADEQAELDARVQAELDDLDAYYRSQAESEAEGDATIDVEARVAELIIEEAVYNLNDENATYEDYAAYLTKNIEDAYLQERMKEDQLKDVKPTAEQVLAEYESLLNEQQTYYAETPEDYKYDQEAYEMSGTAPVAFVPEGYSRILHIYCAYEGTLPDEYEANAADMEIIRDEYSELAFEDALNGTNKNATAMQERIDQYKALEAANDAMYETFAAPARTAANDLHAQLVAGVDFATLMLEHSSPDDYSEYSIFAEKGILIAQEYACDNDWSEAVKAEFAKLSVGQYSEVFEDENGYHIIFYLADEPAGARELSAIEEGIRAYLIEEVREEEWAALLEAWMGDGSVTLHKELCQALITA